MASYIAHIPEAYDLLGVKRSNKILSLSYLLCQTGELY